jgi:hypothetical protein
LKNFLQFVFSFLAYLYHVHRDNSIYINFDFPAAVREGALRGAHGDPRYITKCDPEEKENINKLVERLKMMSVHDQAYAHTYSIAVRQLPSLKDFLRAPPSVDHAAPSQSHSSVNVASHQTEEKFDVPEPPRNCYYCGKDGCRMSTCAALSAQEKSRSKTILSAIMMVSNLDRSWKE